MTYYENDFPEFTFISTPDVLNENLTGRDLSNPYLLLKYRPTCECGKEFRSSGKDKAEAQLIKHVSHKKYSNCKPVVSELDYSNVIPSVHTINMVAGSDANSKRNNILKEKISYAGSVPDIYSKFAVRNSYGIHIQLDGTYWNMNEGTQIHLPTPPKVIEGLQLKNGLNITAKVISKTKTRLVKNDTLKVCEVTLEDATGKIPMTLWNDQVTLFKVGDVVKFTNATAKEGKYYAGREFGYVSRTELGAWKNATQIEVISSEEPKEIVA